MKPVQAACCGAVLAFLIWFGSAGHVSVITAALIGSGWCLFIIVSPVLSMVNWRAVLYWLGLGLLNVGCIVLLIGIPYLVYDSLFVDHSADDALVQAGDECIDSANGNIGTLEACWRRYPWTRGMVALGVTIPLPPRR
jgi:hypothetical protein